MVLKSIKRRLRRPVATEHEVFDLKTGKKLKLLKIRKPDGTYDIQKVEEAEPTVLEEKEEKRMVEEVRGKVGQRDLLDVLEKNVERAIEIRDERDTLAMHVKELEDQLGELEEHKAARKVAEKKLVDLEEQVVSMKDEKTELEDSISKMKDEREDIAKKIGKYEKALLNIKERIVDFDSKLK